MANPLFTWVIFLSVVLALLVLDLGFFHKKNHVIRFKESLWLSFFYFFIAVLFGLWILYLKGSERFAEYMTGLLVEKTLALDNIFLISLIFSHFSIPLKYQHRVLFWGILGVIVLRGVMIGLGTQLLHRFEWILYLFGFLMIITGIKMFFVKKPVDLSENVLIKWMGKHINITQKIHGQKFFVYEKNKKTGEKKLWATPLFVALIFIEGVDFIFAVDSIPAIFAITQDPYIVYTSNIFAILGLRALYFTLLSIINRFYYLKYALAVVLIFIGSKIFIPDIFGINKIPPFFSLTITFFILLSGVMYSCFNPKTESAKRIE